MELLSSSLRCLEWISLRSHRRLFMRNQRWHWKKDGKTERDIYIFISLLWRLLLLVGHIIMYFIIKRTMSPIKYISQYSTVGWRTGHNLSALLMFISFHCSSESLSIKEWNFFLHFLTRGWLHDLVGQYNGYKWQHTSSKLRGSGIQSLLLSWNLAWLSCKPVSAGVLKSERPWREETLF